MTEIESFKILEEKVNELIKRCVFLQEENRELKEALEKTERDMYGLIENQDELKNKNKELSDKLYSITNNSIVKNIIHNIDEIMSYSEEGHAKALENKETEKVEVKKEVNNNSYNYGINIPQKTNSNQNTQAQNTEIKSEQEQKTEQKAEQRPENTEKIIHIDENEDPFSSATDESWDKEINANTVQAPKTAPVEQQEKKKEFKEEVKQVKKEEAEEDSFVFSIDEDDEYIFGDDEEGGFAFDEKN